jgi:hypothetical protein
MKGIDIARIIVFHASPKKNDTKISVIALIWTGASEIPSPQKLKKTSHKFQRTQPIDLCRPAALTRYDKML